MITAIIITSSILVYLIGAGITHGWARHRFDTGDYDIAITKRFFTSLLWPLSILLFGVFFRISDLSFSGLTKRARKTLENNKKRIAAANKTRVALEHSKQELQEAEEELERELAGANQ